MIEQELELPFETAVLGVTAAVKRVDLTDADEIVAVCYRSGNSALYFRSPSRACGQTVFTRRTHDRHLADTHGR